MKQKLERIAHIANRIACAIDTDNASKNYALAGLGEIQKHVVDVLAEIEDRIVFVDELKPYPRPYKTRATKERIIQACEHHLETGKSLKQCEREFGLGNDTLRASTAVEYLHGKVAAQRARKKRRVRKRVRHVLHVDGLLTARGVADKLGITKTQVERLLERTRRNGGLFPLPVNKKHVGAHVPANVWKPEDIDAYKEINGG